MFLDTTAIRETFAEIIAPNSAPETVQTAFGAARLEKITDGFWTARLGNLFKYGKTRDQVIRAITRTAQTALQIRRENY